MTRKEAIKELQHFDVFTPAIIKTAINVAIKALKQPEIIYCKDCKFYSNNTEYCQKYNRLYCMRDDTVKSQKHYCSYAERKDD